MKPPLLQISNLQVSVEGKSVIEGLGLEVRPGEVIVITGANGSGKSSLAMTLLGDVRYNVATNQRTNEPTILFDGKDLLGMTIDERARAGVFVAWQNPVSIPGVSVFSMCKTSYESRGNKLDKLVEFKQKLDELVVKVGLAKEYISRDVNGGFSGGERKRLEIMQMLLLGPKLVILDEIDSGIDVTGLKVVVRVVHEMKKLGTAFVLITHNENLLSKINVDKVYEMKYGRLSARV